MRRSTLIYLGVLVKFVITFFEFVHIISLDTYTSEFITFCCDNICDIYDTVYELYQKFRTHF